MAPLARTLAVPGLALAVLMALATAAPAGQIVVPRDVPDLQQAIDGAASGDVIIVQHGAWGPLVIDKPLTLVGDTAAGAAPLIEGGGPGSVHASPITLAGPGRGVVRLARLEVGGTIDVMIHAEADAGVSGGGFEQLVVTDCTVRGPLWPISLGAVSGESGIDVSVPLVIVERSLVEASPPAQFDCAGSAPDGATGLRSDGTVVVLDSRVLGSGGVSFCLPFGEPCPTTCPPGGMGGSGAECALLLQAGSIVRGGKGSLWVDFDGLEVCCRQADGADTVAGESVALPDDLRASGPTVLGSSIVLTWTTSGGQAALLVSPRAQPPVESPAGWLLLDLSVTVVPVILAAPGAATFALPSDPALAGAGLGLQLLDATDGLTRPLFFTLLP